MTKLLVQHWLTVIPLDSCRWMQNVRLMSIHQHVIYKMLSTLERGDNHATLGQHKHCTYIRIFFILLVEQYRAYVGHVGQKLVFASKKNVTSCVEQHRTNTLFGSRFVMQLKVRYRFLN